MGHKRSPAEKRMRGFLSGDPLRVARTVDRTCGIADLEVHKYMAVHVDALVAATQHIPLPPEQRATLDRYIARLKGGQATRPQCPCQGFRGDPSRLGGSVRITNRVTHAGWSEMRVTCDTCARSFEVTEDVGYHVPQYSWRAC